ncbi:MAG: DNA integrity scanning protein DisA nucleotide-binding domain protein [Lachnospiraceae bacterium]|nr:DNA integrity scanning protein DisA nucleotide-binding domain protein [Lachnospiraceae bacterium]
MTDEGFDNLLHENYEAYGEFSVLPDLMYAILDKIYECVNASMFGNMLFPTKFDWEMVGRTVVNVYSNQHCLRGIEMFSALSELRYEGHECEGRMIYCEPKGISGDIIHFDQPLRLEKANQKRIRKLLEATGDDKYLLVDAENSQIIGIGRLENPTGLVVEFCGFSQWRVVHDGKTVFECKCGNYKLVKPQNEYASGDELKRYKKMIELIVQNKHGALIIQSDHAEEEAVRLCDLERGYRIKGINVFRNHELIEMATRIDGAILVDEKGRCYAMGVILDGPAAKGNPEKGARHNSAKSYVAWRKKKKEHIKAIVVSEDGPVTVFD